MPSVLIVGAGLSGLACARAMRMADWAVTVVDKGRGVGGRLATRRLGTAAFDTGAQFFTVRDGAFAAAVAEWEQAGVVGRWCDGFPTLDGVSGADGHPRYRALGGMNRLAKHLALGIEVRDQRTVTGLTGDGAGWRVTVQPGDLAKPGAQASGPAETLRADAVVVTAPVPQAIALLERSALSVDPALRQVRYDPCFCLLVDLPRAVGAVLPAPGGVRIEHDPAIGWLCSQRAKGLRSEGDGLIVHARGGWSAERYEHEDATVLAELVPAARAVWERAGVTDEVGEIHLKRWRYSLPTMSVGAACVRVATTGPLVLAGDAFGDRPRMEGAWLSGMAAAGMLVG